MNSSSVTTPVSAPGPAMCSGRTESPRIRASRMMARSWMQKGSGLTWAIEYSPTPARYARMLPRTLSWVFPRVLSRVFPRFCSLLFSVPMLQSPSVFLQGLSYTILGEDGRGFGDICQKQTTPSALCSKGVVSRQGSMRLRCAHIQGTLVCSARRISSLLLPLPPPDSGSCT